MMKLLLLCCLVFSAVMLAEGMSTTVGDYENMCMYLTKTKYISDPATVKDREYKLRSIQWRVLNGMHGPCVGV